MKLSKAINYVKASLFAFRLTLKTLPISYKIHRNNYLMGTTRLSNG